MNINKKKNCRIQSKGHDDEPVETMREKKNQLACNGESNRTGVRVAAHAAVFSTLFIIISVCVYTCTYTRICIYMYMYFAASQRIHWGPCAIYRKIFMGLAVWTPIISSPLYQTCIQTHTYIYI